MIQEWQGNEKRHKGVKENVTNSNCAKTLRQAILAAVQKT